MMMSADDPAARADRARLHLKKAQQQRLAASSAEDASSALVRGASELFSNADEGHQAFLGISSAANEEQRGKGANGIEDDDMGGRRAREPQLELDGERQEINTGPVPFGDAPADNVSSPFAFFSRKTSRPSIAQADQPGKVGQDMHIGKGNNDAELDGHGLFLMPHTDTSVPLTSISDNNGRQSPPGDVSQLFGSSVTGPMAWGHFESVNAESMSERAFSVPAAPTINNSNPSHLLSSEDVTISPEKKSQAKLYDQDFIDQMVQEHQLQMSRVQSQIRTLESKLFDETDRANRAARKIVELEEDLLNAARRHAPPPPSSIVDPSHSHVDPPLPTMSLSSIPFSVDEKEEGADTPVDMTTSPTLRPTLPPSSQTRDLTRSNVFPQAYARSGHHRRATTAAHFDFLSSPKRLSEATNLPSLLSTSPAAKSSSSITLSTARKAHLLKKASLIAESRRKGDARESAGDSDVSRFDVGTAANASEDGGTRL